MRNERGAIIIHVAIALFACLLFTGMVIDQGAMYTARRQGQNAADAGALAGAITLLTDPSAHDDAVIAAKALSNVNAVWGQASGDANIDVTHPITCPDTSPGCIRVDVLRGLRNPHTGTTHTNTFPTLMMGMLGITRQGVRATATAQVAAGNLVNKCIKPWAVADKWVDNSGTGLDTTQWDQMDFFEGGTDVYTVPGFKSTGLGNDYGLELMLKGDADWSSGWSLELELGGGNGSPPYEAEIAGCPSWVPPVGLYDSSVPCRNRSDTNEPKGCVNVNTGVRQGPTVGGVASLLQLDRDATWDVATKSVVGGCTDSGTCRAANPAGVDISPRVVPIVIFNPQNYLDNGCSGNGCVVEVVNLLGFFVEGMCDNVYATPPPWCGSHPNKTVVGRLMNYPGQYSGVSGSAGPATFLKITRLVQ